jgi:hypothetical protein
MVYCSGTAIVLQTLCRPYHSEPARRLRMTKNNLPTVDFLRKLLRYDAETGMLYWRERPQETFQPGIQTAGHISERWNKKCAGTPAGTLYDTGYVRIQWRVQGVRRHLAAHRVAWALYYGEVPTCEIDHINGNRSDNRISNLREATRTQNNRNRTKRKDNTSGVAGIYPTPEGKWRAVIGSGEKNTDLGTFSDRFDAILARLLAERKYGYTMRHGL